MKKNTVVRKMGSVVVVMALSLIMITGCGKSGDRNSDEVQSGEASDPAGMVHLDSVDDVSAFMEEVYGGVAEDLLPPDIQLTELDMNDTDMVAYHAGLKDLTGVAGVYLSESMMSSTPYSAVYVRTTDDADVESIRQQLMDNIDPAKWVCVMAEKECSVMLGKDVFFVMGFQDTVDEVMSKVSAAAKSRGMELSDVSTKENPI